MIKNKRKYQGFALVSVMVLSTIVLIITGVIFLRISQAGKEITKRERMDQLGVAGDAVISKAVDWLNIKSYDTNAGNSINVEKHTLDFIGDLYDTTKTDMIVTPEAVTDSSITLDFEGVTFPSTLGSASNIDYTQNNFLNSFMTSTGTNALINKVMAGTMSSLNTTTTTSTNNVQNVNANDLPDFLNRRFQVKTNPGTGKFMQEVKLSIIPLSTNITDKTELQLHGCGSAGCKREDAMAHTDIMKVMVSSCYPDCSSAKLQRNYEVIIQRPVVLGGDADPKGAMVSLGDIITNGGGSDTVSGTCATCPSDAVGTKLASIRTNGSATAGMVDGNVTVGPGETYTGSQTGSLTIANAPFTLPQYDANLPTTQCPDNGTVTAGTTLSNCWIDGSTAKKSTWAPDPGVYVSGTIYVKNGSVESGVFSTAPGVNTAVRIVTDLGITISGNDNLSGNKILYVSKSGGITWNGNVAVDGVFVNMDPNESIRKNGNSGNVFGAVISYGTIDFNGHPTMHYDKNLGSLNQFVPPDKQSCMMRIVSWKELK